MPRLVVLAAILAATAALLAPPSTAAAPRSSWRCIAGICLWESRETIVHKYGAS